jgi:hypothetical protein
VIVLSLFIVHRKKCSINICVLFDVLLICLRTLALEFLLIIIYKLFTMLTLKNILLTKGKIMEPPTALAGVGGQFLSLVDSYEVGDVHKFKS